MTALPRTPNAVMGHSLLRPLAAGLAAAALTELLILRTFTRTAVHIPAIESMAGPYEVISDAGRFAYFVTVVLLLAALPALALMFAAGGERRLQAGAAAIVVFLAGAAGPRLGADELLTSAAILGATALLIGVVASSAGGRSAVPWLVFGAATLAAGSNILLQQPGVPGQGDAETVRAFLTVAEYLGIGFAIVTPLVAGGLPAVRGQVLAVGVGGLAFAGMLAAPTTRILLLWNQGFTGSLPAIAYGVGAAAMTAALLTLWGRGRRIECIGLLLVAAGGMGLQSTYQSALVIAGLALFASAPMGANAPATDR